MPDAPRSKLASAAPRFQGQVGTCASSDRGQGSVPCQLWSLADSLADSLAGTPFDERDPARIPELIPASLLGVQNDNRPAAADASASLPERINLPTVDSVAPAVTSGQTPFTTVADGAHGCCCADKAVPLATWPTVLRTGNRLLAAGLHRR